MATIRRWWEQTGRVLYPTATRLLVTADAGAATATGSAREDAAGPAGDQGRYPPGVRVSDRELAAVPLQRHGWHGEWNSTVLPDAA